MKCLTGKALKHHLLFDEFEPFSKVEKQVNMS